MPAWVSGAWADGAWFGTSWFGDEGGEPEIPESGGIYRYIPSGFQAALETCGTAFAVCIKVVRRDGTVLGFTSWDRSLTIYGDAYDPCSVFDMSQIAESLALGQIDNGEFWGAVQSGVITDDDLRAGLYRGARVRVYLVIPTNVSLGTVLLKDGWFGEYEYDGQSWRVQFVQKLDLLSRPVGALVSPTCPYFLGDSSCGVDLSSFTHDGSVSAVTSRRSFVVGAMAQVSGYFNYGLCTFLDGANADFKRKVKLHTLVGGEAVLEFQEEFPHDVAISDGVRLIKGCDGLFATCVGVFANGGRFGGFPHLPGNNENLKRTRQ